jgi:hypothetical protein
VYVRVAEGSPSFAAIVEIDGAPSTRHAIAS